MSMFCAIQGITTFSMMFGFVGIALLRITSWSAALASGGAMVAGLASMLLIQRVFLSMTRLHSSGTLLIEKRIGGELGAAYLGTQGDVWDAHKDMALASLGALIAMSTAVIVNMALKRDFAHEFAESLRIKSRVPLGEEAIGALVRERQRPTS